RTFEHEVREEQAALAARQRLVEPAPLCFDPERAAQLDPHRVEAHNRTERQEVAKVAYVVNCECGYVARGETVDEVVQRTRAHIQSDHPDLAGTVTNDDIASWAQLAQD